MPELVSDFQASKQIDKKKKEIITQQKKINEKIEKILKNPSGNDPVYQTLQKLFKHDSPYNLDRNKNDRYELRELSRKRFELGYPPRKKDDNSIGDAVNWEWIIKCAISSGLDIILVTRDSDYGAILKNESFLNDWLKQEFKERVGAKRKIILTERLSVAFKAIKQNVSKEMIDAEDVVIKQKDKKHSVIDEDYSDNVMRVIDEIAKLNIEIK